MAVPLLFIAISQCAFSAPISDSNRLLGLLYSDAYGYLTGATRLTSGLNLDVARAMERFGFVARASFDEGLDETIAWYRSQR